ncbi:MAG: radical SAM protein [Candidatus Gastranaerophilaceae bacterium]
MTLKTLYKIQKSELTTLNHLFIELTEKNCNQHCKHCYIDFPLSKAKKDFINIDKIKQALEDTKTENIYCIYLTGAEPMLHPDFNSILRLCLTASNVCICTNGTFLNEKKIRFLKRVDEESENEIIFMLPIDHFDEIKSDNIRSRGAYRQVLHASKILVKYQFNPIFSVTNYYKEDYKTLIKGFEKVFENIDIKVTDSNFLIHDFYNPNSKDENLIEDYNELDCQSGRILTEKGIYACPFLANDHRGRMGADFSDFGKKMYLETPFCQICAKNKEKVFSIDFKKFEN